MILIPFVLSALESHRLRRRDRRRAARAPNRAAVTVIAALLAVLLTGGLGTTTAAGEDVAQGSSSEAPTAQWPVRLAPDLRLEVADETPPVQSEPEEIRRSGARQSVRRETSPFSLLPGDSRKEVEPAQSWALLTEDEKVLSDKGVEAPKADAPKKVGPDWPGIGRDTAFFFAYQAISVGILYVLPGDFNRWSNKDLSFERWWDNVRNPPVWDSDPWGTNFITHPYWGATYYIRARERGFGKFASFGYSALLSTLYEYGAEAFFEPPSAQDLMVTPILGSLLGAFIFEPIRDWIKVKPELKWYDQAVLIATDPFGALNSTFEVMFGIKSEILFRPTPPTLGDREPSAGLRGRRDGSRSHGASVSLKIVWE